MRVTLAAKSRAEVWGQPVSHSLSPSLHNAAYQALGLEAHYERREVSEESLPEALASIDHSYLGVSLTMPLKEAILPLVADHRGAVDALSAANTVVNSDSGVFLWNTDPAGVLGALSDAGINDVSHLLVLGAGATARSVIFAVASRGLERVTLASRDESRAQATESFALSLGLTVQWVSLDELQSATPPDLVASTLPTGVDAGGFIPSALPEASALFDVTYHPWPTPLATLWDQSGMPVATGLSMLAHQALIQVRLFVGGSAETPLASESDVLRAMKDAVGLPTV